MELTDEMAAAVCPAGPSIVVKTNIIPSIAHTCMYILPPTYLLTHQYPTYSPPSYSASH